MPRKSEFKDVVYPDAQLPVLSDIGTEPGRTAAFIGGTGSGKVDAINLIPSFL